MKDEVIEFKRERILQEAVPLFAEHGFQGVSIDTIAKQLNVTKPFIYTYFENKHALLEAIYERAVESLLDGVDQVFAADRPAPEQLKALVEYYVLENLKSANLTSIFLTEEKHLSEESQKRVREKHHLFDNKLTKLLKKGVKEGVFQIDDPVLVSFAISGMVRWVHRWYSPGGRLKPEQLASKLAKLALNTVCYDPARSDK
ncbi:TetR family transcriptional regulator [Paraburkholderia sp. D1E]|uniref:TetR family transcriptional regulator n=1 Tax=Paraburkholderia sp. D1E TaxID=3461398 RepID=UPI0040460BB6